MQFSSVYILYGAVNVITKVDCINISLYDWIDRIVGLPACSINSLSFSVKHTSEGKDGHFVIKDNEICAYQHPPHTPDQEN